MENRCLNTESDFCTRAYALIAQWVAGQITDEEFVDGVVELRQADPSDDVESDEEIENSPTYPCLLPDQLFDYDLPGMFRPGFRIRLFRGVDDY